MFLKQLAKNTGLICCLYLMLPHTAYAQSSLPVPDTLRLEIKQAEKTFLDNNLQLLAQHYNIQSAQALVEQARKWDNPLLLTDQNIYTNGHFLQHGIDANGTPQGQVFVQVQQLIKTAGKRGKQVDLAKTNVMIAEWQFKSVMRELRATLIKDFFTAAQLQANAALYNENMLQLLKLRHGMEAELNAGNIARKEYLRVEALIISLQQDIADNIRNSDDVQAELKTILSIHGNVFVLPVTTITADDKISDINIAQLMDTAKLYNTDYGREIAQLQYNRANLSLQRALAVPDITVGPEYDQASSYTRNYVGLTLSLPLPLLDRNKGNIKAAGWEIKQQEAMVGMATDKLQNDVTNSYQKLLYTIRINPNGNAQFYNDYYQLQQNIVESYNRRQISLIEFLQYFNDYQDIRKKQLQQELNLRLLKLELNDVVGKDILPL